MRVARTRHDDFLPNLASTLQDATEKNQGCDVRVPSHAPRALSWSRGGGSFSHERGTPVGLQTLLRCEGTGIPLVEVLGDDEVDALKYIYGCNTFLGTTLTHVSLSRIDRRNCLRILKYTR